jgi:hypothetical protein
LLAVAREVVALLRAGLAMAMAMLGTMPDAGKATAGAVLGADSDAVAPDD